MRQRRGGNNNASGGTNINPVNNNNNENEENNNNEISRNNEAWEVLTDAEFFFVKQRVDWAESFTGIEEANQYTVFDEQNKEQFKIIETQQSHVFLYYFSPPHPQNIEKHRLSYFSMVLIVILI